MKTIDLEIDKDGVYSAKKNTQRTQNNPTKNKDSVIVRQRVSQVRRDNVGEFFYGMDKSIDILENLNNRLQRMFGLRKKRG